MYADGLLLLSLPVSLTDERECRRPHCAGGRSARGRSAHSALIIADAITAFSGRMVCVYVHAVWFGVRPFDPSLYGFLTMVVSLEAIFLSTLCSSARTA